MCLSTNNMYLSLWGEGDDSSVGECRVPPLCWVCTLKIVENEQSVHGSHGCKAPVIILS